MRIRKGRDDMGNIKETQYFQAVQDKKVEVSDVLEQVYIALTEKGYNPVNQIVGYIMSGDPTYITSHKGARISLTSRSWSGFERKYCVLPRLFSAIVSHVLKIISIL